MHVLIQFILRLSLGLAAAMTLVSPRQVTSGYYRNNLYVLLGLNVFAALVIATGDALGPAWPAAAGAVVSYAGAVCWLYEKPRAGLLALGLIALLDLAGAVGAAAAAHTSGAGQIVAWADPITGGGVLGVTMAAMLLGHWYLNSPGMPLAPLVRLIAVLGVMVALRAVVCGYGLAVDVVAHGAPDAYQALFLSLRWLGGLVGTALLAVMAWRTLQVPNTQSATGILYVAVITTFLGELASQLLSGRAGYPL